MTRVVGLLLFGLVAACSSKPTEPEVDPKAVAGFTRVLQEVGGAEPTRAAALLADGAYKTIAPSEKCLERYAAAASERERVEAILDCVPPCTDARRRFSNNAPRKWMAIFAEACRPDQYGLEHGPENWASPDWLLVYKVGQIVAPHLQAANAPERTRLKQALAAFRLSLPLAAEVSGRYELPVASAVASVPVRTRAYVLLDRRGIPTIGVTPSAIFGEDGNAATSWERDDRREETEWFPGELTIPANMKASLRELAGVSEPVVTLLVADEAQSAADVIEIGLEIDSVLVAVASPDDVAARALPPGSVAFAPAQPDEVSRLSPGTVTIPLFAGEVGTAKQAAAGSQESVLIRVKDGVSWSALIAVAEVAIARGAKRVVLTSDVARHDAGDEFEAPAAATGR